MTGESLRFWQYCATIAQTLRMLTPISVLTAVREGAFWRRVNCVVAWLVW